MGVAAHHTADHDQHSGTLSSFGYTRKRTGPARVLQSCGEPKAKGVRHSSRNFNNVVVYAGGSYKRDRVLLDGLRVRYVPLLPLLTDVDGIEEVGTGTLHSCPRHSSEVRYRDRLLGGNSQEQESSRGVSCRCETLQLLERRLLLTRFPGRELRKANRKALLRDPRAFARPSESGRLDLYPNHARHCAGSSSPQGRY